MRKLVVSTILFLLTFTTYATNSSRDGVHEQQPYEITLTKHVYKFSEIYQIKSPLRDTYPGSIKKSAFRIRTNYDLSNKDGWQATGITRVVSLGSIYPWAKDIDIYDTRGAQIGLIYGELATLESAKFSIYEYDDASKAQMVGIAYADPDFKRFVILESNNNPHPIAEFNRNTADDSWNVSVHYPEKIDDRIIRIFAGFIVDYENKFLAKPDELEQLN